MGDRTYVSLRVLNEQALQALTIIEENLYEPSEDSSDDMHTFFGFEEVNYADLCSEKELQAAGIAYDKKWDAGDGYAAGEEHCRFTPDGKLQLIELYAGGDNAPLHELMARLHEPEELRAYILQFCDSVTPLPWDNQAAYGALHAAQQP